MLDEIICEKGNRNINYPIRVAQIIGKMQAGGVESVVFNYYRAIDKTRIQFDFFFDGDSSVEPPMELINTGARFFKLPPYQQIWRYLPALYSLLKKNRYTIVHSHLNTLSVFPLAAAKAAGIPVRIAHNHSVPDSEDWKRAGMKQVLRCFSKIFSTDYFACSEKAGRWLFGDKAFLDGRIKIIKNAVDFDKFQVEQSKCLMIKDKLNIEGNFIVGHVGRFTYAKNHKFILEIFQNIALVDPNAKLLLVGDGELRNEIENEVERLKLGDHVIITGSTQHPEDYYAVMNVIILPSFFEGLPVTAIEAQVSGVPIVVSEAVPKDAMISDGYKHLKLTDSAAEWSKIAIEISRHSVNLMQNSRAYDIKEAAPILLDDYVALYVRVKNECNE